MTSQEYWAEVESFAKSVITDSKDQDQDLQDTLHESIDGHEWIIYTYRHRQILEHSSNTDYARENGLTMPTDDLASLTLCYAFWAFYADVSGKVQELLCEGYGQEEETDDESEEE